MLGSGNSCRPRGGGGPGPAGVGDYMLRPETTLELSEYIGEELTRRCDGTHRHIEFTGGGRTGRSEVYPDKLCRALLNGLLKQIEADGRHGCSYRADKDVEMNIMGDDDPIA